MWIFLLSLLSVFFLLLFLGCEVLHCGHLDCWRVPYSNGISWRSACHRDVCRPGYAWLRRVCGIEFESKSQAHTESGYSCTCWLMLYDVIWCYIISLDDWVVLMGWREQSVGPKQFAGDYEGMSHISPHIWRLWRKSLSSFGRFLWKNRVPAHFCKTMGSCPKTKGVTQGIPMYPPQPPKVIQYGLTMGSCPKTKGDKGVTQGIPHNLPRSDSKPFQEACWPPQSTSPRSPSGGVFWRPRPSMWASLP